MNLDLAYNQENFVGFLDEFLPNYTKDIREVSVNSNLFSKAVMLGTTIQLDLTVFEITLDDTSVDKRIAITTDAFKLMKQYQVYRALIVFNSADGDTWRLSLMTSQPIIENGRVITKLSNPRRYSYLMGPNAKTATPYKYLIRGGRIADFEELKKRFSIEVVNKDFYNSIAELYTKLVGGKRKQGGSIQEYPGLLKIKGQINQSLEHQEFAVRLIGRLVFCWFLREKKSLKGTSLIPDTILSAKAAQKDMYYHTVLSPLFFELLNQKHSARKQAFSGNPHIMIPYLNGGLFSPQKGDGGDYYEYSESIQGAALGVVDVPDSWLREFTELLDTYNFTVDENTSFDADLSVDPEMLGRIFENLLAEINPETGESARKSTGSFYTPREIVEYMVDRSLVCFLRNKTGISTEKLEALVSYGLEDDALHPRTLVEDKTIVDALAEFTILDPACGSGAFPIGVLQKVVYILQQADKDAQYWLERQLRGVSPELKRHLEQQYEDQNYDYLRKLGVIRESIFGVDIQPIATEIARLRCFLTLIVEEEVDDEAPNRGIQPLPNLDFKFVCANSLVRLPTSGLSDKVKQQQIFEDTNHIDNLRSVRNRYFGANSIERLELQSEFNALQTEMALKNIDEYRGAASTLYNSLTRWKPFEHSMVGWFDSDWMFGVDKFDVIISNPPWGAKLTVDEKKVLKDTYPSVDSSTPNSFAYFIGLAIELDADVLTYVLPDSIMTKDYAKTRTVLKPMLTNLNWYQNSGVPEKFRPFIYVEHDVCVMVATKNIEDVVEYRRYDYVTPNLIEHSWLASKKKTIRSDFENVFNLLASDADYKILDKLAKNQALSERLQCHEGIHTGNSREILFSKEEKGNAKPLFYGGSAGDMIDNYVSKTSGWFVDYRPKLIDKKQGYYASLRDERIFSNPKLFITRTGNPLKVFLGGGEYASNNFFSLQLKDYSKNNEEELRLILPFINSRIAQYFIRTFAAPRIGSTFIETKIIHLLKLPVPMLTGGDRNILLGLVSEAIESKKSGSTEKFNIVNEQIQVFIYKLYDLEADEISIIENVVR